MEILYNINAGRTIWANTYCIKRSLKKLRKNHRKKSGKIRKIRKRAVLQA